MSNFIKSQDIKSRLRSGKPTIGSWLTLGHSGIAEIMAQAGFDWLVVDLEHSIISIETAGDLIRVIDLCGVSPLVRLTSNNPDLIKRVLDAGAHGVVVPMVNSADDAQRAIASTRYGPRGTRGVGLARAQGYGPGFKTYLDWQKNGPIVIAQIEHKDAVSNLESILAVPGVNGFIIGPYDLSCSMGIPGEFDHPIFINTMDKILKTGLRLNVPSGIHIVEPDLQQLEKYLSEGYQFIAYSVDIRIIDTAARAGMEKFKEIVK